MILYFIQTPMWIMTLDLMILILSFMIIIMITIMIMITIIIMITIMIMMMQRVFENPFR